MRSHLSALIRYEGCRSIRGCGVSESFKNRSCSLILSQIQDYFVHDNCLIAPTYYSLSRWTRVLNSTRMVSTKRRLIVGEVKTLSFRQTIQYIVKNNRTYVK